MDGCPQAALQGDLGPGTAEHRAEAGVQQVLHDREPDPGRYSGGEGGAPAVRDGEAGAEALGGLLRQGSDDDRTHQERQHPRGRESVDQPGIDLEGVGEAGGGVCEPEYERVRERAHRGVSGQRHDRSDGGAAEQGRQAEALAEAGVDGQPCGCRPSRRRHQQEHGEAVRSDGDAGEGGQHRGCGGEGGGAISGTHSQPPMISSRRRIPAATRARPCSR